jgi:hypothetical protein
MTSLAQDLDFKIEAHRLVHGRRPVMMGLGRRELAALRRTHPESVVRHEYGGIPIEEREEESFIHFYSADPR